MPNAESLKRYKRKYGKQTLPPPPPRQWKTIRQAVSRGVVIGETQVPERAQYVPTAGAAVLRKSSLVDAEGGVIQQWIIESPEAKARWEAVQLAIAELHKTLPPIEKMKEPDCDRNDLLTVYPVGDHHLGMLAWGAEVGADYDIDIGERLLAAATDHLVSLAPNCEQGLIVFLGDFLHYDSMVAETPKNNNPLDADGRAGKMVPAAMRAVRRMIEAVAGKHRKLRVIFEFGNHDPMGTLWLMHAMAQIYTFCPSVSIDCNPSMYHYFQFGKNLIATQHGDQVKMDRLPGIVAASMPQMWGETTHRIVLTGHIHQFKAQDYPGCTVESFRILPPNDAWAHGKGYRSHRDMKALVFHNEHGEIARYSFNPDMMHV